MGVTEHWLCLARRGCGVSFQKPPGWDSVQRDLGEPALVGRLDYMISRGYFQDPPFCDSEQGMTGRSESGTSV